MARATIGRGPHLVIGLVITVLVLLAACTSTASPTVPGPPPAGVSTPAAGPLLTEFAESKPVRLKIPSIEVDSGLIDLGLQPDGSMEVPADGSTAGWYAESPTPGELGPAVLAAHVDWKGEKGVFYDLRRTKPGDIVTVERADGSHPAFVVQRVEQYPEEQFPSSEVYGDVDTAQLRLTTCGGDLDDSVRSYRDNVVVFADLITA